MKASLFDYRLPSALIAQNPVRPRDACRLMVVKRDGRKISETVFSRLPSFLKKGDVLVLNDSKVIPARIIFKNDGKETEIFLTRKLSVDKWLAIGRPGKRLKAGAIFRVAGVLDAEILEVRGDGQRLVRFNPGGRAFDKALSKAGSTPLPPYIKSRASKPDDYQTVFASKKGSVAAPTAGLHFTDRLLKKLKERGVVICFVTLHVGLGTFLPLKTENIREHKMHGEFFQMDPETTAALNKARKEKRRIVAVGTTAVRVLESSFSRGRFKAGFRETSLYIFPGYKWKCVDALITNFHLPKSTLLLLTCSFGGMNLVMKAYEEAIRRKFRFYSFGDAMLIE